MTQIGASKWSQARQRVTATCNHDVGKSDPPRYPMVDVAESGSDSGSEDMPPAATEDDPASDQAVSALSVPVWLQRRPPWCPLAESSNPDLRHISTGVSWALRRLMLTEADWEGWVAPLLDERRCPLLSSQQGQACTGVHGFLLLWQVPGVCR